ncbi:MAG: peptidoglycan editing factor PgeF [Firmicutes bacterium]|nr:peptidoglycan editing factor PgeF [Bacillota bacterium]
MRKEEIRSAGALDYLVFTNLLAPEIVHAFTLRSGGVSFPPYEQLNMGLHVSDRPEAVLENRRRLAAALGYEAAAVVVGEQVHGTKIVQVTSALAGAGHRSLEDAIPTADGLICAEPGIVLMAHAADCTLLYFYDPLERIIGLAHAGWRGAVAQMGPLMIDAFVRLGSRSENIRAALSPSIGPCCYQVGAQVIEKIPAHLQQAVVGRKEGYYYFDLPEFHRLLLLEAGLCAENIVKSSYCTACHTDLFYSYRMSGGRTGRMAGIISMKW